MSKNIPDKDYVINGLLCFNYFPMVKEHLDEIPSVFSSKGFTPKIAQELITKFSDARPKGYDQIEYRASLYNNLTRQMHIPHPLPYAKLCICISDNWDKISDVCTSDISQIKPARHEDDRVVTMDDYEQVQLNRVIVMDKKKFPEAVLRDLELSSGNHYLVHADISSCFSSIYTHSIPWALVGQKKAKANFKTSEWYNALDKYQRSLKRDETQGIPIGPGTSNIIAEVILSKIDNKLSEKGFNFIRFIDDYKCYCSTQDQADDFLVALEQELREYLLSVNGKKVKIQHLPLPHHPDWIMDLQNRLPPSDNVRSKDIADLFDYAINLQKQHPEGSVLKYTARSLVKSVDENNVAVFLKYLVMLSFYYPVILPILCDVAQKYPEQAKDGNVTKVIAQHIKYQRSDAVCWCLFFKMVCQQEVEKEIVQQIIDTKDCMSMAMLLALGKDEYRQEVKNFLTELKSDKPEYDFDQYWLLIYQFQELNEEFKAYCDETGLSFLAEKGVKFLYTS